ncbi:MAG: GyrI-like domain-containing protein [Myxococcota bacterium]
MSDIEIIKEEPRTLIGIRRKVNVQDLAGFFAEVLPKVFKWVNEKGITPASAPMAMWCSMDMESGIADTHAGFFVAAGAEGEGEITAGPTVGGEVLKLVHQGGYDSMGKSWGRAYAHANELGRKPGPGWEIYIDDPEAVDVEKLRTEIYLPVE